MSTDKYNHITTGTMKGYLLLHIQKTYLKIILQNLIEKNIITDEYLDSILIGKNIQKINKIIENEINKDVGKIIVDLALT